MAATASAVRRFSSDCSDGPCSCRWVRTARAAASVSACLIIVPPDAVMSASGKLSSPYAHGPPSITSMNRLSPATTPMGRPPPRTLPYVVRSARTSNSPWTPRWCDAEPRDDLVEHQQEAVLVGEPAQLAQELDRLEVRVPRPDRLDEHQRELIGVRADDLERSLGAVLQDEGVVDHPLRDAGHHGHRAQRRPAGRPPARGRCRSGRGCRP